MTPHTAYSAHISPSFISHSKPVTAPTRKRVFGYCRVSTDMQAQFGLSLEAQQNQIASYARIYGYEVIGYYVDHDSAKSVTGRPEYQKMMIEVDKGKVEYIISTALDRFSRSQRDFLDFQDKYVQADRVHLVIIREGINTELAASKQYLGVLVAFAQLERERTSERVKGIISYIRSQGGHFGKVPFGYATVSDGRLKRLIPHPENYMWLEQMAEWYREGMSFGDIAHGLNVNGVKPSQSPEWTQTNVYDLLIKERIHVVRSELGDKVYDKERAYNLAYALKSEGKTFNVIAERLNHEGLRPGKASEYRWWSVQDLLRSAVYHDRSTAKGCAKYWKAQGKSLREIAMKLMADGHRPKRGGQWFAQQVKQLLIA
jgi:DNA invertase Pin-like site-specific DNA recombinase